MDRICERIIAQVCVPYLPVIRRRWFELVPPSWEMPGIDGFLLREVLDRSYNLALDRLIEQGVLPPPREAPPCGYWGINGRFEVL